MVLTDIAGDLSVKISILILVVRKKIWNCNIDLTRSHVLGETIRQIT